MARTITKVTKMMPMTTGMISSRRRSRKRPIARSPTMGWGPLPAGRERVPPKGLFLGWLRIQHRAEQPAPVIEVAGVADMQLVGRIPLHRVGQHDIRGRQGRAVGELDARV